MNPRLSGLLSFPESMLKWSELVLDQSKTVINAQTIPNMLQVFIYTHSSNHSHEMNIYSQHRQNDLNNDFRDEVGKELPK